MPEQRTIKCPFCEKGDITTLYTPRQLVTKYARAASNTKRINYFKDEKHEILSEKCPNCGKSKKEIEKRLKEGKPVDRKALIKRIKEQGLPSKIY